MIITDEKSLRMDCKPTLLSEIDELRDKLDEELNKSAERGRPGIGLAAPQIGIAKDMAIIRIQSGGKSINIDLVNAKIIEKYDEQIFHKEGCLSFPGKFVRTKRFKEIVVENEVEPKKIIATGLLAVCIQHELDHIKGILLTDLDLDKKK